MSKFKVKIQKIRSGKYRVCFVSAKNGKLVLQGEPLENATDARRIANGICDAMGISHPLGLLLPNHKWPGNSGPKKKP